MQAICIRVGWSSAVSEIWEEMAQIGSTSQSIFLFVLFLEHMCLWQMFLLQPLMPILAETIVFAALSNCANLARLNKFLWVAAITACGEAASEGGSVFMVTGE